MTNAEVKVAVLPARSTIVPAFKLMLLAASEIPLASV